MTDATPKTLSPAVVTEDQQRRRAALVERIGAIADLACQTPLAGDLGDVAYDLLRQAAAQISSDGLRLASLASPERPVERRQIESALRYARGQADSVYGITWAKLEEISRFELFVQALSLTKPTTILSELSGRSGV